MTCPASSVVTSPCCCFFFSSRRRHTRLQGDWSSDVCSSDLLRKALYVGFEGGPVGGTLHAHRRADPFGTQRTDEGDVLAPVPGRLAVRPLPFGCPGVEPGEGDVGRALVHEHQPPRIDRSQALSPSASRFFVPLGGTQRLFLNVQPSLRTARLMVETDTLAPPRSSHNSQWCASVASSFSSSCSHKARLSCGVAKMEGVRPGEGFGTRSPVCLLRLRYLSMVGIETPKVLTTSLLGIPRSTASSTFSLRSSE